MNIDKIDGFEKDQLLRWFLHFLPMGPDDGLTKGTRTALMQQMPVIYNKLAEREIVRVMHVTTGTVA